MDAWELMLAGLRECGIDSRRKFMECHHRQGCGEVRSGCYINGHVQEALLGYTRNAVHCAPGASMAPAMETVCGEVAKHIG